MITDIILHSNVFTICIGSISPGEVFEFVNDPNVIGSLNHLMYSYYEDHTENVYAADITHEGGNIPIYTDVVYDLHSIYGKPYKGMCHDKKVYWICINPIPSDAKYTYQTLKGPLVTELEASDVTRRIVTLKGNPIVNDVELQLPKVGKVKEGKPISLNLKENDKILILEHVS